MKGIWLCVLLMIGITTLLLTACLGGDSFPTPRSFATQELLIEPALMPSGWYVSSSAQAALNKWGQHDGAFIQFDVHAPYGGLAQHQLYRFFDNIQAGYEFQDRMGEEYFTSGVIVDWHEPIQLPYRSQGAQQFRLACADYAVQVPSGRMTLCEAMAQYDEYVSIFNTHIIEGYMSYDDLGRILKAIDEKMARYLSKSTPPATRSP